MKVQCELCKEIVPIGRFRSSDAGIDIDCAACGGHFFVPCSPPSRDAAAVARTEASTEPSCPKCGTATRAGEPACRTCGLRAELFDGFVADEDASALAELEPLWDACVSRWDDPGAHTRFLEAVSTRLQYTWAARRYRTRLRAHPGDAVCEDQLGRIARMAQATLASSGSGTAAGKSTQPYKNVALLLILLLLFAGLGGIYFLFKLKTAPEDKPPPPGVQMTKPPVRPPTLAPSP